MTSDLVTMQVERKLRDDLATLRDTLGCNNMTEVIRLLFKHGQRGAVEEQYKRLKKEVNGVSKVVKYGGNKKCRTAD